jgi:hypothetical protein
MSTCARSFVARLVLGVYAAVMPRYAKFSGSSMLTC